ncbi:MAG: hypothetical protein HYW65_01800 [Candidatus Liptonbacteria bacterium]|nr:hypothetical protein [Candidatus Liptonbacteria bacterium]
MNRKAINMELSYEYIRGVVEGEGCFTFSKSNGRKIPAFAIRMHIRDKSLICAIRDTLGLRNKVYVYDYQAKDRIERAPQATLIVREFGQLKNIIVPFFYKRLRGNKRNQFELWLEKIGNDPSVPESFKFIYKIYKAGFYDKNPKFP